MEQAGLLGSEAAGVCAFLGRGCDRPLGWLWLAGMLCIYTPSEQKEASGDQAGIPTIPPGFNEGKKSVPFLPNFVS